MNVFLLILLNIKLTSKLHKGVFGKFLFLLTIPKQEYESLSAPSLDCICKAGASSWSYSINLNRTGNLSLLLLWTVSAQQAPLPVQFFFSLPGLF